MVPLSVLCVLKMHRIQNRLYTLIYRLVKFSNPESVPTSSQISPSAPTVTVSLY